jgi:hypothetical protein
MDVIVEAPTAAGTTGLQHTEITQLFSFNVNSESIEQALTRLEKFGAVRMERGTPGARGGRPCERWVAPA